MNHAHENRERILQEIREKAVSTSHTESNKERKEIVKQQEALKKLEEEMTEPTKENPPMKNVL